RDVSISRSRWEQCRLGEAASLRRGRNFFKGRAQLSRPDKHAGVGFLFVRASPKNARIPHLFSSQVPPSRILEKQNHLLTNVRIRERARFICNRFFFSRILEQPPI